jgi:hypothetical protein
LNSEGLNESCEAAFEPAAWRSISCAFSASDCAAHFVSAVRTAAASEPNSGLTALLLTLLMRTVLWLRRAPLGLLLHAALWFPSAPLRLPPRSGVRDLTAARDSVPDGRTPPPTPTPLPAPAFVLKRPRSSVDREASTGTAAAAIGDVLLGPGSGVRS